MTGEVRVLQVGVEVPLADQAPAGPEHEDVRFVVDHAETAAEALGSLDGVDCVVSEQTLPVSEGLDLLRTVRETHPDLPFVLFTDAGSETVASEAISAGVTDYIPRGEASEDTVLAHRVHNAVEQYRSRRELASSRERLSLFIEQSPIGVVEWDEQFDFVRMNDAGTDILGYADRELRGDSWERIVPPSDQDAVQAVVADLLENQGGYHSVNENVRKDGERVTCEWHNRVITDDDGDTVAIFSQFQDVTERKRQAEALEESEARYQSLTEDVLDTSEVGTVVTDEDHDVVWMNSALAEYVGVDEDELVGASYETVVDVAKRVMEAPEAFAREIRAAYRENDAPAEFECHVVPGDGRRERWLRHWSRPIRTGLYEGGRIAHYTDVTDRKQRNQQLDAMDRVLRHNFHNSMSIVLGNAETIAATADGDVADRAEVIMDTGRQLLEITSKQRQVVELLSNPADVGTVDLSRAVRAAVEEVRARYPDAVVDATVPDGVSARAIPELEDAVVELLDNAVVHADEAPPTVTVTVESDGDQARVRVADTGPGIPDSERAILSGDGEGGPLYHGSGMGLWLVNWVVTYSDGTVQCSENDPRGNVVVVELAGEEP
jgi:PAS domain S-box-containing protein